MLLSRGQLGMSHKDYEPDGLVLFTEDYMVTDPDEEEKDEGGLGKALDDALFDDEAEED
jgi:hypothetical protein